MVYFDIVMLCKYDEVNFDTKRITKICTITNVFISRGNCLLYMNMNMILTIIGIIYSGVNVTSINLFSCVRMHDKTNNCIVYIVYVIIVCMTYVMKNDC